MRIHQVQSSNVAYAGYAKGVTLVAFKSKNGPVEYVNTAAPQRLFASFCRAKSKGKFFHKHYKPLGFTKAV